MNAWNCPTLLRFAEIFESTIVFLIVRNVNNGQNIARKIYNGQNMTSMQDDSKIRLPNGAKLHLTLQ